MALLVRFFSMGGLARAGTVDIVGNHPSGPWRLDCARAGRRGRKCAADPGAAGLRLYRTRLGRGACARPLRINVRGWPRRRSLARQSGGRAIPAASRSRDRRRSGRLDGVGPSADTSDGHRSTARQTEVSSSRLRANAAGVLLVRPSARRRSDCRLLSAQAEFPAKRHGERTCGKNRRCPRARQRQAGGAFSSFAKERG